MINTSNAWKTHVESSSVFDIRATMTGGSTVNLTNEDFILGSASFTDSISSVGKIKFGSVVTNTFTATLLNTNGRFDNWTWNRISVEFGYNGEWIKRGTFNIDRPDTIGSTVKIECYDDMDRLNQYFKGFITQTFPITYKALIQAICTACGVTFGTWGSGIPNTNVTALVASAFNESTTCRQVVSWILEVCGAYARINPVTNKLDCKVWNGTGSYALTGVKEQSVYIDDVTVTGVRAYTYNTNDEYDYATAGTDGYIVYIKDNPFVSATNKQTLAEQALTNGGGGSVRPFNATIFGDPAMEAGDIVTLTDNRNNTYTSIITSISYTLCGGMRVSCDAKTPQDNSLDYSNPYDSAVWASIAYTDNAVEEISSDLQSQIDAKIETYYQNTDPSTTWTTTALKNAHVGDIWHNSDTNKSYRWGGTAWQEIDGVPQSLLDTVDGKTTIHYGTTSSVTTADDGDYLVDKTSGITYRRQNNAWVEQISSPAVNLLPPVYRREYQQGSNTYTNTGITWTVNDDGSITANGTATATSYFTLTGSSEAMYPPRAKLDPTKRYRLHGCPSGGSSSTFRLTGQREVDGANVNQYDYGSGVTLTANAKYVYVLIQINSGYTATNLTFYPMLEEGMVDHAYVSPKTTNSNYTNVQISSLQSTLETQIDAKVETWASSNNPATAWTTTELKNQHNGDLWYYTGTGDPLTIDGVTISPSKTYQYNASTGKWVSYNNPSESLYDFADGKSTIYYGTTSSVTSADDGDYLVDKTNGMTYQWTNNAWVQQIASPVVNLMPTTYQYEVTKGVEPWSASGVTWTLNKDGSITATGTATATSPYVMAERNLTYTVPCITVDPTQRYILHGCPANGTSKYRLSARCTPANETPSTDSGSVVYDYGDGALVPVGTKYIYTYCQVLNGYDTGNGITFYPMLEVGTERHGFVSNRTNTVTYTQNQVAPFVQNLMPSTYYSTKRYGTEFTGAGLKWTTNADGTITVSSQSGTYPVTASSATTFTICANNLTDTYVPIIQVDPSQRYIVHGCPAGGSSTTYRIRARCTQSGTTPAGTTGTLGDDTGNGYTIPVGTKYVSIYIQILSGATLTQAVTFRPMLEVGTIKHGYVSSQQSQENTFNKLTNYGSMQGLYMDGGDMYINATYIKTGSLEAERIGNGTIGSAITASNLTMTGGSVNITTSDRTLDKIIFNNSDGYKMAISTERVEASHTSSDNSKASTELSPDGIWIYQNGETKTIVNSVGVTANQLSINSNAYLMPALGADQTGEVWALGDPMIDTVIAEGTWGSAGWWRKWHSGKAECHGYASVTTAISTPYGVGYYASTTATFPTNLFVAGPVVNITLERNGGLLFPSISSSSKNSVNFYIASLAQESSATIWYHVSAFGKWKS